jgi:heme exporter protein B
LVGWVAHESGLYPQLTLRENLIFAARMGDVDQPAQRADESLAAAALQPHADRLPAALSQGMRQRLAITRALLHDPAIVLLDEPFAGLDAEGTQWLLRLLDDLHARGRTLCFATHDVQMLARLADRAVEVRGPPRNRRPARLRCAYARDCVFTRRMNRSDPLAAKVWWIMHKDLVCEYRDRRVWPAMLLSGVVVAMMFALQMDMPPEQRPRLAGGLLWLAFFVAAALTLDRSFAAEREEGCWEGLLLYPTSPATIYLAKLAVNVIALAALQVLLTLLFVVLCDVPLLDHPWAMLLVLLLGNVGVAALGTLVSALVTAVRHGANLSVLLVLPMVIPVLLAAAEATRLIVAGDLGAPWWRWVQMLAAFAAIYITAGTVLFNYVVED